LSYAENIAGHLPSEGRVGEGKGEGRISFFKAEKGRRRKGGFKKSFSERKMKEGGSFGNLRRKG